MPLYIEKINGDVNRPTGRIECNLPFRKLENRKKICKEKSNIGDDNLSMQRPRKQNANQCALEDQKAQVLRFFAFKEQKILMEEGELY